MAAEIHASALFDDRSFAAMVEAPRPGMELSAYLQDHRGAFASLMDEHPALVLRGFAIGNESDFARTRDVLLPEPADYLYRSTPRTAIGDRILTTTEYPPDQEILLHCENAYQRNWPRRLVFCCLIPARSGGQTPIADIRRVTEQIGEATVDLLARRRVRYSRCYHQGFDLDWREVFQTDRESEVEQYCRAHEIQWEWLDDGLLRTRQVCQGVACHPRTGDRLWFNQAHLFHPSALGREMMDDMIALFGDDFLPRDARFGDGGPIDLDLLDRVRDAFREESRQFDWKAGDVMIVDNMLVAHGRRPFDGDRRVLVSMGVMTSESPPAEVEA